MENASIKAGAESMDAEWDIETFLQGDEALTRLCQSSWSIPIFLSSLYLLLVHAGRRYMENKPKFSLRPILFAWSFALAVFSIVGTYRTLGTGFKLYREGGIHRVVCDCGYFSAPITRVYAVLFTWSKFLEYIDTAFIILRKQPLIFLHWYHHFTVALFCWLMYGGKYSGGYVFMELNFVVHSCMYSYYAIRAAGYKTPRFIPLFITSLQIIQMVMGCLVMAMIGFMPDNCTTSSSHLLAGSIMYFSYLVLFFNFFYKSYLSGSKRKDVKEKSDNTNGAVLEKSRKSTFTNKEKELSLNGSNSSNSLRKRKN